MHKINYSVIIPTYNSAKFIGKLLGSIPKREDIEVIIIDDHSSDYEKLEKIAGNYKYVKLMKNTKNQGAGNARQLGLENAHGKWILFADSDDRFADHLDKLLDKYVNVAADIVLFMPRSERLDGSRSSRCDYYLYLFSQYVNNSISALELSCRLTNVWSKLYRREMIINAEFQDTMVANDVQFAAQTAFYTRKNITVDNGDPFYILTERPDSITSSRHRKISKYITRSKIRIANDQWLRRRLRHAGEQRVRLRRYESIFRKIFMKGDHEIDY